MVVADAATVTLTGLLAFTTVLMVFDVAGLPVTQAALEVITQYTASPVVRPVVV